MRRASFTLMALILLPALAQAQINRGAVNRGPAPAMQRPAFSPPPAYHPAQPIARPPVVAPRPTPLPAVRPGMIPQTRPIHPVAPVVKPAVPVRPVPGAGLNKPGIYRPPVVVAPVRPAPVRPVVVNSNHFAAIAPTIYNPHRPYGNYFRPYAGNVYRPYGWANYGNKYVWGNYYATRYYHGWNNGYWNYFWFPAGFVPRPVPLGWLLPATAAVWAYYNPYYLQPPAVQQFVDYSQPLPAPTDSFSEAPVETPLAATAPADDPAADEAANLFAAAREMFQRGDYDGALKTIDSAIAKLPQDPTLHEFRAQTLFAVEKFQESAAAIYAVLAAGPGWDADTLFALYPNKLAYNRQLAALERFAAANPANGAMQFLLGYQYLTLGDKEKAVAAFDHAVRDEPKDEVSKALAENLRKPPPAP